MLCVSAYTHEHRPYLATLYPTSYTLDSPLALGICAQRKARGLCFTSGPMTCVLFFVCLYILEREGRRTYTGGSTGGHSNHQNSIKHKSRELGKF